MPNPKIPIEELIFRRLDPDDDLSGFLCRSDDLNDFLKNDALAYQQELVGVTYLCSYQGQVVGFMTLSTDSIKVNAVQNGDAINGVCIKSYPALKIGRLGVDQRFERQNIGTFLLYMALGHAVDLASAIGCRFVIVDTKKESMNFYKKRHLKPIKKAEKKDYPTMYLDFYPIYMELKKRRIK